MTKRLVTEAPKTKAKTPRTKTTTRANATTKAKSTMKAKATIKARATTKTKATTKTRAATKAKATTKARARTKTKATTKAKTATKTKATTKATATREGKGKEKGKGRVATARICGRPTCIDIYCGAGGTTFGAMQAGLDVVYGLDCDESAVQTFARNHPRAYADCRDVASVSAREILKLSGVDRVDYLLSGPNCQAVLSAPIQN